MPTTIAQLRAILTGDTKQFDSALKRSERGAKKFGDSLNRTLRRAFVGIGVGVAVREIVKATVTQEAALRKLEQAIEATGRTGRLSTTQVSEFASAIQRTTTFADEAVIDLVAFSLQFRNIGEEVLPRAIKAILDFSAFTGRDAVQSAKLFGIALNDPTAGMGRLSQAGVSLSTSVKETIKTLTAQGKLVQAQTIFLDELEKSFKGAAEAARDTLGGSLQSLKNAFGDLLEADSGIPATTAAINHLTNQLQTKQFQELAAILTGGVVSGIRDLGDAAAYAAEHAEELKLALGGILGAVAGNKFGPVFAAIGGLLGLIAARTDDVADATSNAKDAIEELATAQGASIGPALKAAEAQLRISKAIEASRRAQLAPLLAKERAGEVGGLSVGAAELAAFHELEASNRRLVEAIAAIASIAPKGSKGIVDLGAAADEADAALLNLGDKGVQSVGEALTKMAEKVGDAQAQLAELKGEAGAVAARSLEKSVLLFRQLAVNAGFSGEALRDLVSIYRQSAESLDEVNKKIADQKAIAKAIEAQDKEIQSAFEQPFLRGIDNVGSLLTETIEGALRGLLPPQLGGLASGLLGAGFSFLGIGGDRQVTAQHFGLQNRMLDELKGIGNILGSIAGFTELSVESEDRLFRFFGGGEFATDLITAIPTIGQGVQAAGGFAAGILTADTSTVGKLVGSILGAIGGAIGGAFLGQAGLGATLGAQIGSGLFGPLADKGYAASQFFPNPAALQASAGLSIGPLIDPFGIGTGILAGIGSGDIGTGVLTGVLQGLFGPFGSILSAGILGAFEDPKYKVRIQTVSEEAVAGVADSFIDGISRLGVFGVTGLTEARVKLAGKSKGLGDEFVERVLGFFDRIDRQLALALNEADTQLATAALQGIGELAAQRKTATRSINELLLDRLTTVLGSVAGDVGEDFIQNFFAAEGQGQFKRPEFGQALVEQALSFLGERGQVQELATQARVLAGVEEAATDASKSLEGIRDLFAQIALRGPAVGVALEDADALLEQALGKARTDFVESFADQILAITDPLQAALDANNRALEEALREAEAFGAETILVRRRFSLEEERILKQFADRAQSLLDDLLAGPGSTLAPTTVLANARAQFAGLRGALLGGDTSVVSDLVDASRNLLDAEREVSASSQAFEKTLALVVRTLASVPGVTLPAGGSIPGFQHGGSFRVPGSGGPDSVVAAIRATPGEVFTAAGPGGGRAEAQREDVIDRLEILVMRVTKGNAQIVGSLRELLDELRRQRFEIPRGRGVAA